MSNSRMIKVEQPVVAQIESEETPIEDLLPKSLNKMVSLDDPLRAFQVILTHADVEFIGKLGRLLSYIPHVMSGDQSGNIPREGL